MNKRPIPSTFLVKALEALGLAKRHYAVYALQSAKTACPFYIGMSGMGTDSWGILKRLRGHKAAALNGTRASCRRVRELQLAGDMVICSVIRDGLSLREAGLLETKLIREAPAGLLTNVHDVPRNGT